MGFRVGAYCKVFEVEPVKDTLTKLRISISKKNKETGEYETSFSGYVACVGTACAGKAAKLTKYDKKSGTSGDTIILGDIDVTMQAKKSGDGYYTNFSIYSFEVADGNNGVAKTPDKPAAKSKKQTHVESNDTEDDSHLPF